jgi:hypothetical protein
MGKVILAYDTLVAFNLGLIIALTFTIVLAATLIAGRPGQRRLRRELDQISARITALELAEKQRLMIEVISATQISCPRRETMGNASYKNAIGSNTFYPTRH